MRLEMTKIGAVSIDSGLIVMGDPEYIADRPEFCCTAKAGVEQGTFDVFEMQIDGVNYVAIRLHTDHDAARPALVEDRAKQLWRERIEQREREEKNVD